MRRHWQKKPLLVRAAMPDAWPALRPRPRSSRWPRATTSNRAWSCSDGERWALRQGPFARRALPALKRPRWTCWCRGRPAPRRPRTRAARTLPLRARRPPRRRHGLVRHRRRRRRAARRLVRRLPAAGAGAAALAHRPRRAAPRLRDDVPLKMLADFEPEHGVAARAGRHALPAARLGPRRRGRGRAASPLDRLSRAGADALGVDTAAAPARAPPSRPRTRRRLRRPRPARATRRPRRAIRPVATAHRRTLRRRCGCFAEPTRSAAALGEALSEPKPGGWFERRPAPASPADSHRGRRACSTGARACSTTTRHVFINGESYRAGGRDATLMRRLADRRRARCRRGARARRRGARAGRANGSRPAGCRHESQHDVERHQFERSER